MPKNSSFMIRLEGMGLRLGMAQINDNALSIELKPYWKDNEVVLLAAHEEGKH